MAMKGHNFIVTQEHFFCTRTLFDIEELQRRLVAELQAAFEQAKLRSNDLDRQTSFAYRRQRQQWW